MSGLELAVVVPTYKERDNVGKLFERLTRVLAGVNFEVVFVDDDSPDGTSEEVRRLSLADPRVRTLCRIGRRGLSSACVEGMMSTAAPYIAVMDADMQHDESVLPAMLAQIRTGEYDLIIGTRNAEGGSMGEFAESRIRLSQLGRRLSRVISHHEMSDPMSGFFLLRRSFLEEVVHSVSGIGFKILLDIVASSRRPVRIGEVPYRFRNREFGESKLDILVGLEYLQLVLDKALGEWLPVRFVIFCMMGGVGALLHLAILYAGIAFGGWTFGVGQTVATIAVMISNFLLNNFITYRDRQLRGFQLLVGVLTFCAACSGGAFVNVRVATFLAASGWPWWIAAILGLALGSVWNYGVSAVLTWRQVRRRTPGRTSAVAAS